jgi:ADP-heptose:LPS heptosyltransferase
MPAGLVEDLGPDFDPGPAAFVDTAAALMACDLFITTDTSVAHLAGALGVKTWVAMPHLADWRWLEYRSDSPWYPSMRLFRQTTRGDWRSVFAEIGKALRKEFR